MDKTQATETARRAHRAENPDAPEPTDLDILEFAADKLWEAEDAAAGEEDTTDPADEPEILTAAKVLLGYDKF